MTESDRLERDLTAWLRDTATPALPDYTDDIVRQATHVRQPHRWTFFERWLPMTETALQPVRLSPVPWRPIAVLALVALAMVAGIALTAANRPAVPAPFGLANNGLVAYSEAGDIFTVDPVSGARRQITTGLDDDRDPHWSPDGSRIAFLRGDSLTQLVIVDADGGNPVTSIGQMVEVDGDGFEWVPDGSAVAVVGRVVQANSPVRAGRIVLVDADDGSTTSIGAEYLGYEFAWRPPLGRQLLFSGSGVAGPALLLYSIETGQVDELPVVLAAGTEPVRLSGWTADGTRYAYQLENKGGTLATRVVDVATSDFVDVPVAYGHISNDGTRVVGLDPVEGHPCVAPVAGGECHRIGSIGQSPAGTHHSGLFWSPDDRWVVSRPWDDPVLAYLLDPEGSAVDQPAWLADGAESWQRVP